MSKIGKINISIPEKVKVALAGNNLNIEGPLGKKSINQKTILTLVIKLNGIKKTEELASKYRKDAILLAKKIDNLKIQKEMIELIDQSLNRKK